MDDVFKKLDYTHDQLDLMLYKLHNGHVLTKEEYDKLYALGFDNISAFSGDYNDLINKPDFVIELEKAIELSDIETKGNIDNKLKQLTEEFNNCYMDLNNNIRTDIALMESEIMELIDLIAPGSFTLTSRMEALEAKHAEDIQKILGMIEQAPTYTMPTLSLSISPSRLIHQEVTTVTVTPKYTQNDGGAVVSYVLKSGNDILLESDKIEPFTHSVVSNNNTLFTYTAVVTYEDGPIKNTNAGNPYPETSIKAGSLIKDSTIKCYAHSYYGAIDTEEITENDIPNFSKVLLTSKGSTQTFTLKEGQRSVYMYPANFGDLSSIKDANNFDYIDSYNLTKFVFNEVIYNVYTLKDPVQIDGFKQIFN